MVRSTPARVKREELRAELARELCKSLDRHGLTQTELATACGVTKQRVQEWCDASDPTLPQVQDIALMPELVALDLLRWTAGKHSRGLVTVTHEESINATTLANVVREVNEVTTVLAIGLADGELSVSELEKVRTEAHHAASECHKLEATAGRMIEKRRASLRAQS